VEPFLPSFSSLIIRCACGILETAQFERLTT